MTSDFNRYLDDVRRADAEEAARETARREADAQRQKEAEGKSELLLKQLRDAAEGLAAALLGAGVATTLKIVTPMMRPRTLLELWRGFDKGMCTDDVIVVQGWKFEDSESSTPDFDSRRVDFLARGYLLSTDGWIHRYNLDSQSVKVPGALVYKQADWNSAPEWSENGPLRQIAPLDHERLMKGLARLALENGISSV